MCALCVCQDFEAVWRIVSRRAEGRLHPVDVMRAVTGEMRENRKAVFLKVRDVFDSCCPPEGAVELLCKLQICCCFECMSLFVVLGLCKA